MTSEDPDWKHAGISEVKSYDNGRIDRRIRVPDRILGRNHPDPVQMFKTEPGNPIYWYYNRHTNIVCISNDYLDDPHDEYKWIYDSNFSDSSSYRVNIPRPFFSEFTGDSRTKYGTGKPVPETARFEVREDRHFVYNTQMEKGEVQSCYIITEEQFNRRFRGSDLWDLSSVPRFS